MKKNNRPYTYSHITMRLAANRRNQWQWSLKVTSWQQTAPELFVQSPGLWLPEEHHVTDLDSAAALVQRLVSEPPLPLA